MRKTKIICTLGPSTDKDGVLEELVKEGMNVARFNFSHGLHDEQKGRIDKLKEIRTRLNKPVAALLDTKGPEIRIREFENGKVTLKEGQEFTLTTEEIVGNEKIVSVTYKDLYKDVKPGNSILIDQTSLLYHYYNMFHRYAPEYPHQCHEYVLLLPELFCGLLPNAMHITAC